MHPLLQYTLVVLKLRFGIAKSLTANYTKLLLSQNHHTLSVVQHRNN